MNRSDFALILGGALFFAANVFDIREEAFLQTLNFALLAFCILNVRRISPAAFFFPIFVASSLWLIGACVAIFSRSLVDGLKTWGASTFIRLAPLSILLALAFWTGGNLTYNLARYAAIVGQAYLIILFSQNNKLGNSIRDFELYGIFALAVFVSILSKYLNFSELRLSVFNGSENVAFVIVATIYIASSLRARSILFLSMLTAAFLLYVYTTESRLAAATSVVIIGYLFGRRYNRIAVFVISAPILYFSSTFFLSLVSDSAAFNQMMFVFQNLGKQDILVIISAIDVRGRVWSEAVSLVWASPIIGHGAIAPSVFPESVYGIQEFHNSVLDILITFGFVGLGCYLAVNYYSLSSLEDKRPGFWFIIAFFIISSLFQPIIFNIQPVLVLALALVATSNEARSVAAGRRA